MGFGSLWLPVIVSAVLVFVVSSILHMVLKHHAKDYSRLPDEEGFRKAMQAMKTVDGGMYRFPFCTDMKETKDPAFAKKLEEGPNGVLVLMPRGPYNMGKSLGLWFGYCVLVSFFCAYVARVSGLREGAEYMTIMRVVATTAACAYVLGEIPSAIWKGESWGTVARFWFDGLLYALVTGGTFGWLWPSA
jgi:hypothetical protein